MRFAASVATAALAAASTFQTATAASVSWQVAASSDPVNQLLNITNNPAVGPASIDGCNPFYITGPYDGSR